MSKKTIDPFQVISTDQMRDAIEKSGYLIEHRVEQVLSEQGYYVQTNPVFPDPITSKSREYDISALSAIRLYKERFNYIFASLICECENNAQPTVFFTRDSPISFLHHHDIKVSGIPVQFRDANGDYISFSEFTGMEGFHHYCKGAISTQYCTFQFKKDKSSWFAFHSEEQHDTFDSLIKALDYEVAKHYDGWVLPGQEEDEDVNIQIYYPVVILQGPLYTASLKDNNLTLKREEHVQFRKEIFSTRTNESETYQIDVISEGYLLSYLKLVQSEMEKVKKVFQRKKDKVLFSIEEIIRDARKLKNKRKIKSFRECLEF